MNSNTLLTLSCFLAAVLIIGPSYIEAKCNTCTEYGIACINETAFNLCFGNKIDTTRVMECPGNKICSATKLRCVDRDTNATPACQPNKGCGICQDKELFACTSRTTFAQCNNGKLTKVTGVCPKGLICETRKGGDICVDECNRPDVLECDRETPMQIE